MRLGPSIRLRLTLFYVGLLVGGTSLLLVLSWWLLGNHLERTLPPEYASRVLEQLGLQYAIAIAGTALVALGVGWLAAGRALAPIRTIVATLRRISEDRLDARVRPSGPPDELHDLAVAFDSMLDRVEGSVEAQRRFVANASHELRTPLTIMRTEAEVALDDPDASAEELREVARAVVETTDRTELLLDRLLLLAVSTEGARRDDPVDLAAVARRAAATVAGEAAAAGVDVRLQLDRGAGPRRRGAARAPDRQPGRERGAPRAGRRRGADPRARGRRRGRADRGERGRRRGRGGRRPARAAVRAAAARARARHRAGALDRPRRRRGARRAAGARGAAQRRPDRRGAAPGSYGGMTRRSLASCVMDSHISSINPLLPTEPDADRGVPDEARRALQAALWECKRVVVGQDAMLERVLVALLAGGHVLLEGVPGLAKTLTVRTLADVLGGTFNRVQFTPDLVPADLVGTRIWQPDHGEFRTELGPVFANLLLADEINRAPAKVQSALLEVMQERQVTIGGTTYEVPSPFLVLATQNPIESEGTYALPEAQLDRFLFKLNVDYPEVEDEVAVVQQQAGAGVAPKEVLRGEDLLRYREAARDVHVDRLVATYAVHLADATRNPAARGLEDIAPHIEFGASPRASIGLIQAGQALAMLRGRTHVTAADVHDLAPDVLRHRLVLSYDALADGVKPEDLLDRVLEVVAPPGKAPLAEAA